MRYAAATSIGLRSARAARLHRLRRHRVLRLARPRGWCLRAERGTLWITVDGDPDDITLGPGQSHRFDGRAPAIVSTLSGDAVLSATPPRTAAWWERLLDRLALPRLQPA